MDTDAFEYKEHVRKPEEYTVSRISKAARTKLEKLRRRTGLNYASIIDLTLGIKFKHFKCYLGKLDIIMEHLKCCL